MTTETMPAVVPLEPTTREQTTADVLRAAARYIEEHGWCQGDWQDDTGAVCIDGAISVIATGHAMRTNVLSADAVEALLIPNKRDYVGWNDTPGRTRDEVLAALRASADAAESPS